MATEDIPSVSNTESTSPGEFLREQLEQLVPGIFQDGVLDAVRLGELLGAPVAGLKDGKESFGLMWAGRKAAAEALHTPSFACLAPVGADSIEWDTAENVFIVGDNLEVLKLMQTAYNDQVKLVYIDPPYNTGNDFVYNDDFSDPVKHYLEVTGQIDAEGNRLLANSELSGRKHSNWLTMMYPRLVLARNMLLETGSIWISIDDYEVEHLRELLNLVFGRENFLGQFIWPGKGGGQDTGGFARVHDYVLAYARNIGQFEAGRLTLGAGDFGLVDVESGRRYKRQLARKWGNNSKRTDRPNLYYAVIAPDGSEVFPMASANVEGRWRWSRERFESELQAGNVEFDNSNGAWVAYERVWEPEDGAKTVPFSTVMETDVVGMNANGTADLRMLLGDSDAFSYPKPVALIQQIMAMGNVGDGDVVLDFFAGSGTTADAVYRQNAKDGGARKFVVVQIDEAVEKGSNADAAGYAEISDITRERISASRNMFSSQEHELKGFREFRLAKSSFRRKEVDEPDALFSADPGTLEREWNAEIVFAQVALSLGVGLDSIWERIPLAGGSAIRSGGVVVVTSIPVTDSLIDELVNVEASVVAFLEDGFAAADSVKANAFSKLKNAKKTVRTY